MSSTVTPKPSSHAQPVVFRISPLIRFTLFALYLALTIPLPLLAKVTQAPSPGLLAAAIALGGIALYGVLGERVVADERQICVTYPLWMQLFRQGWSLDWQDVRDLRARTTGQGGLVYYFVSQTGQAYLLPMRVAGFKRLLQIVQERTTVDTSGVRALAQPWMYLILLGCTVLLLAVDAWAIWTGLHWIG
jgi:hypothetical protein